MLARQAGGHVGFYVAETARDIRLLGANHGDDVSIAPQPKGRLIGYRFPKG